MHNLPFTVFKLNSFPMSLQATGACKTVYVTFSQKELISARLYNILSVISKILEKL